MFDNKKGTRLEPSAYRRVQKRVPFSVREVSGPRAILAWQEKADANSVIRQRHLRDKAIGQYMAPLELNRNVYSYLDAPVRISFWRRFTTWTINTFLNLKFN